MRSIERRVTDAGYQTRCVDGVCSFVWWGAIDLAADLEDVADVQLLYRLRGQERWWQVSATRSTDPSPGFVRYEVELSENLFGPTDDPTHEIDVVALVTLANGQRLFDHNRFPGDFENLTLQLANGFAANDGQTCRVDVGRLEFLESWHHHSTGLLRQGGYLHLSYDIDRLPDCRGTHNGHPAWDIVAHLRFLPGGEERSGSVRELVSVNGVPTNQATDRPFVTRIPDDASAVEIWFENYTGAGSSCVSWDSNLGANYRFEILPPAGDSRCLNVEKDRGINAEDPRMVQMAPYCLSYPIDAQVAATHCELRLEGFGDGRIGHYGIPFGWFVAYLRVGPQEGELLNVGIYTRFLDRASGERGERFSLGLEVSEGIWKTGFNALVTPLNGVSGQDLDAEAFAFFIDVRRPSGAVHRLWHSNGGSNFSRAEIFERTTTIESIPYGQIEWANKSASPFTSQPCQ
ncbi:MAG: hypothetical protein KC609_11600 [Myxococcales bacterium]|nr:hypothetical protein [Myxococcales bacterium]